MAGIKGEATQPGDPTGQQVAEIAQILGSEALFGAVHGHIGLPDPIDGIVLEDSDPEWGFGADRHYVRVNQGENGALVVSKMSPYDYEIGMDTMWFAWEEIHLGTDGKARLVREGWPNAPMNVAEMFGATAPLEEDLDTERTQEVVGNLLRIVYEAVDLKKAGKLKAAAQEIERAHQEAFDRRNNPQKFEPYNTDDQEWT